MADVRTGKFCRLFGPVSVSQLSLAVTPATGVRSIPTPTFEKMELARIAFPVPESTTTPRVLNAILLPAAAAVPPTLLLLEPVTIPTPDPPLPSGETPSALVPMKFQRIRLPVRQ